MPRSVVVVGSLALSSLAFASACRGGRPGGAAPSCQDAAAKIAAGMIKLRPDLETAGIDPTPEVVTLCVDDAWPTDLRRCYVDADGPRALRACSDRLDADARAHAREVQEVLHRRASEVGDGPDGPTGIDACDELVATIDSLDRCDTVGDHVKQGFADGLSEMRTRWEALDPSSTPRERARVERDCQATTEALRQSLAIMGC